MRQNKPFHFISLFFSGSFVTAIESQVVNETEMLKSPADSRAEVEILDQRLGRGLTFDLLLLS